MNDRGMYKYITYFLKTPSRLRITRACRLGHHLSHAISLFATALPFTCTRINTDTAVLTNFSHVYRRSLNETLDVWFLSCFACLHNLKRPVFIYTVILFIFYSKWIHRHARKVLKNEHMFVYSFFFFLQLLQYLQLLWHTAAHWGPVNWASIPQCTSKSPVTWLHCNLLCIRVSQMHKCKYIAR